MSTTARAGLAALAVLASASASCAPATDPFAAEQLEIDCRGTPCPWTYTPTKPSAETTWDVGDQGVDLSGTGLAEAELSVVMLQQTSRTLDLRAGVVRDAAAELTFEVHWFAPGLGFGNSFWDRQPVALQTTTFPIWESGSSSVRRTVLVPSEAAALVFRIVKKSDATATAMVGDLTLGHPAGSTP